jgi:hypothetical protein
MNTERTLFDADGQPLGKALTDTMTGETRFIPCGSDEPLQRRWATVEACHRAVQQQEAAA